MSAQLTILDAIENRLHNVTESNGYEIEFTDSAIKRATLTPFKNGDLPAVNYWSSDDVLELKTGGKETRILPVFFEVYGVTRDEPFLNTSLKLSNAVITGLLRDVGAPSVKDNISLALGELVEEITFLRVTPFIGEGQSPWCGAVIETAIRYNITVGDFSTILKY